MVDFWLRFKRDIIVDYFFLPSSFTFDFFFARQCVFPSLVPSSFLPYNSTYWLASENRNRSLTIVYHSFSKKKKNAHENYRL